MGRIENYTVLDMEMTGLSPKTEKVIEIGAVRFRAGQPMEEFSCLVNPGRPVPEHITELTGITNGMAAEGMEEDGAMEAFMAFLGEDILVGQNIRFDYSFLAQWCANHKKPLSVMACDTLRLARVLLPAEQSKKLEDLCTYFNVPRKNAHRALDDARETGIIFERLQDLAADHADREALLKPMPLVYKCKKQTPATAHQIKRLEEYRRRFEIHDGVDYKILSRSEASRLHDQYITRYGRL